MPKRRVSFKLEPQECEALKAYAQDHGLSLSSAGRELIRQSLEMSGREEIQGLSQLLAVIEKRSRRAQIAAYRAYAGMVELIRFITKEDRLAKEILGALVEKSGETLRKEEERGDYR